MTVTANAEWVLAKDVPHIDSLALPATPRSHPAVIPPILYLRDLRHGDVEELAWDHLAGNSGVTQTARFQCPSAHKCITSPLTVMVLLPYPPGGAAQYQAHNRFSLDSLILSILTWHLLGHSVPRSLHGKNSLTWRGSLLQSHFLCEEVSYCFYRIAPSFTAKPLPFIFLHST